MGRTRRCHVITKYEADKIRAAIPNLSHELDGLLEKATKPMAIWLQTRFERIVVLVESHKGWVEVINEIGAEREQVVSHCVHTGGIENCIERAR